MTFKSVCRHDVLGKTWSESLSHLQLHIPLGSSSAIRIFQIKIERGSHNSKQSLFKSLLGGYLTPHNSVDSTLMMSLITVMLQRLPVAYMLLITVIL